MHMPMRLGVVQEDLKGVITEAMHVHITTSRMDCSVVGVKELIFLPRKPAAVKYELDRHLICSELKQ